MTYQWSLFLIILNNKYNLYTNNNNNKYIIYISSNNTLWCISNNNNISHNNHNNLCCKTNNNIRRHNNNNKILFINNNNNNNSINSIPNINLTTLIHIISNSLPCIINKSHPISIHLTIIHLIIHLITIHKIIHLKIILHLRITHHNNPIYQTLTIPKWWDPIIMEIIMDLKDGIIKGNLIMEKVIPIGDNTKRNINTPNINIIINSLLVCIKNIENTLNNTKDKNINKTIRTTKTKHNQSINIQLMSVNNNLMDLKWTLSKWNITQQQVIEITKSWINQSNNHTIKDKGQVVVVRVERGIIKIEEITIESKINLIITKGNNKVGDITKTLIDIIADLSFILSLVCYLWFLLIFILFYICLFLAHSVSSNSIIFLFRY